MNHLTKYLAVAFLVLAGSVEAQDTGRAHSKAVGQKAFEVFQRGLLFGEWKEFYGMLNENVVFYFPSMSAERRHSVGKEAMIKFFGPMNDARTPNTTGIRFMDPLRYTSDDHHVVLETRVFSEDAKGEVNYMNRVFVSLDICGEQICAYREYFGSDRKSN